MPPTSSPFLVADDLGVELPDGRLLFDGLSLSIGRERTALVGANGVGKSVLLDVLVGRRAPRRGRVVRSGRVAHVPQGRGALPRHPGERVADRLGVAPRLAALDRVLAGSSDPRDYDLVGADGWDLPERLAATLARLGLGGLDLDRPVEGLSGGEAARVTLAGALLAEPDLLMLDEPTNDLDGESREALRTALEAWGGGLLVVSHDRELLRHVDRIVELTSRGLQEFGGGWDAWREARRIEREAAEAELDRARAARRRARRDAVRSLERQARRMADGARRRGDGSQPSLVLNAGRERAQGTVSRLGRDVAEAEARAAARVADARARMDEAAALRVEVGRSGLPGGRDVLVAEGVCYTPPGADRPVLDGAHLHLVGPRRVAVTGPNGSGKTTLLRVLAGALRPDAGTVRIGPAPERVAYLDQRTALLDGHATILDAFRAAHPAVDEARARHALARFLFGGEAAHTPLPALSGGERVRGALAVLLGGPATPALLILDEPTNHLDLVSLEIVEAALAAFDGALVVVSHDRDFLDAVGVEGEVSHARRFRGVA